MLNSYLKYRFIRGFSSSRVMANLEKNKPSVPIQPEEPRTSDSTGAVKLDFVPSEVQKKILVWSGRYKSADQIPPRISFDIMNQAGSRLRIKGSIVIMVGTLVMCLVYIWHGKKRAREGDTIIKRQLERHQKIVDEYRKSKQQ